VQALQDPPATDHRPLIDRSRIIRELIISAGALLIGVIAMPFAIWLVGNRILGPYTHGANAHAGPMALLGDFFVGLSQGAITFWMVALGPLVIILFVRLAWAAIKSNPRAASSVAKHRL
jgi:hypothetical protein